MRRLIQISLNFWEGSPDKEIGTACDNGAVWQGSKEIETCTLLRGGY
jgi:hypothetical protein